MGHLTASPTWTRTDAPPLGCSAGRAPVSVDVHIDSFWVSSMKRRKSNYARRSAPGSRTEMQTPNLFMRWKATVRPAVWSLPIS
jgi:hypothetical protein